MKIPERLTIGVVASAFVVAMSPALAAQGRGGGPKTQPVKASGTTHMSAPKTSPAPKVQGGAPKVQGGKSTTTHGPKSTTTTVAKGPKTTSPHTMKGTAASGKTTSTTKGSTKGSSSASAKKTTSTATTTTASTSSSSTTTTTSGSGTATPQLTPVQEKLQKNTNLAGKLESRLPKGTDLMLAAEGFRNLGQFVAAVNVSNNLNIDFAQLKMSMVDDGLSLGQSIQKLRPTADATREASLAQSQATTLLNTTTSSTSTSGTSTTGTTTKKPVKTSGGAR